METIIRATWNDLRGIVDATKDELTVCTPYFSSEGVAQLFDALHGPVAFFFATRLSPSDWIRGISSPEDILALLQILEEAGSHPHLIVHQRLHAKAYIADKALALIGSANLTAGGFENNFEIMVRLCDGPASDAHDLIHSELQTSGIELSIAKFAGWVDRFREDIPRYRPSEDKEAEVLADMQRELDSILGYGGQAFTSAVNPTPDLGDFVQWLESEQSLPGARVLLDRHHNTSGQNLTGHFRQSYYGVKRFLDAHPEYIESLSEILAKLGPDDLFQPQEPLLQAWTSFLDDHASERAQNYDFAILRGILPPSLGGTRLGGGGGSSTLKRMLPLVARFVEQTGANAK